MSLETQSWSRFFRGGSPGEREEWESLRRESDPEFFFEDLLHYGERLERKGDTSRAAEVYQELALVPGDGHFETSIRARARTRLDAMAGRGDWAPRAEFLLNRLAGQAADPSNLLAMGVAGAVFRMTRLAVLSRLSVASVSNLVTRGLGARAVAGVAGFALEAPAFALTNRLGAQAMGTGQDWGSPALLRDLASNYLVLGGMRLAGLGASSVFGRLSGTQGRIVRQASEVVFQQAGLLGGILLGHSLERWTGLRPLAEGHTVLVDSLAMLLQFHVAGRLSHQAFGPGFSAWERGLELRGEAVSPSNFSGPDSLAETWSEKIFPPALASVTAVSGGAMPRFVAMMTMRPESSGSGSSAEASPRIPDLVRREVNARIEELRARIAEADESSVEATRWREELEWLARLGDAQSFFQNVLSLRSLYARNLRQTGMEGMKWLGEAQDRIFKSVTQGELYAQFLLPSSSGVPIFKFPAGMVAPSTLTDRGANGMALLETNIRSAAHTQNLHYIRISELGYVQEVVSEGKLSEYRLQILSGKNFKTPVHIIHDARNDRYQLSDGHHRTMAAYLEGQTYILGYIQRGFVNASRLHTISKLRRVSREEYERVASLNQFGAGMSESMYIESLHEMKEESVSGGGGGPARGLWGEVLRRMFSRR